MKQEIGKNTASNVLFKVTEKALPCIGNQPLVLCFREKCPESVNAFSQTLVRLDILSPFLGRKASQTLL